MQDLQLFGEHVRGFLRWIQESSSDGSSAAREALVELTKLYAAALRLPSARVPESDNEHSLRVSDAEFA
jgi:hypothetical protein